ncbi:MAG: divalent-cation tolerance protein CutA [Akkermansiaceae bacterium]|nr:divalent-cation tolerance protein CutA [Akkermansiaceae bacterium]NNM30674.1 divalent-cation tolerance protein CutA [Akkermansiaceae bacterium]
MKPLSKFCCRLGLIGYQGTVSKVLVVLCTFPDVEQARQIGTALIEKQLAACVNVIPGIGSIYEWQGEIKQEGEVLALIKTSETAFPALENEIFRLHPYDVPEIIALPVAVGSVPYLRWVLGQTGAPLD